MIRPKRVFGGYLGVNKDLGTGDVRCGGSPWISVPFGRRAGWAYRSLCLARFVSAGLPSAIYTTFGGDLPSDHSPLRDLDHRLIGSDLRFLLPTLGQDSREIADLLDYLGGSMLIPLINRFST